MWNIIRTPPLGGEEQSAGAERGIPWNKAKSLKIINFQIGADGPSLIIQNNILAILLNGCRPRLETSLKKTIGFWKVASLPKTLKNLYMFNNYTMGRRPRLAKSLKQHWFLKGGEPAESIENPNHF